MDSHSSHQIIFSLMTIIMLSKYIISLILGPVTPTLAVSDHRRFTSPLILETAFRIHNYDFFSSTHDYYYYSDFYDPTHPILTYSSCQQLSRSGKTTEKDPRKPSIHAIDESDFFIRRIRGRSKVANRSNAFTWKTLQAFNCSL